MKTFTLTSDFVIEQPNGESVNFSTYDSLEEAFAKMV